MPGGLQRESLDSLQRAERAAARVFAPSSVHAQSSDTDINIHDDDALLELARDAVAQHDAARLRAFVNAERASDFACLLGWLAAEKTLFGVLLQLTALQFAFGLNATQGVSMRAAVREINDALARELAQLQRKHARARALVTVQALNKRVTKLRDQFDLHSRHMKTDAARDSFRASKTGAPRRYKTGLKR